jgi:two-component system sensor histidine kinase KdpD
MADTHVAPRPGWRAFATSSLEGRNPNPGPSSAPLPLVKVGLSGEPPWFGPKNMNRRWDAARAAFRGLYRHDRRRTQHRWFSLPFGPLHHWPAGRSATGRYISAALLVAIAAGVSFLLQHFLVVGSLVLPFLIAILLIAIAYGLLPSLLASVLSVLTYDFFFLPPIYSLTVTEPDDVVRLVVFASAALIVSNLAAYARGQAVSANLRAEVAEDLYRFGRQLTGAATLREVLDSSLPRLTAMLRAPVLIILPDDGNLAIYPAGQSQEPAPGGGFPGATLTGTEFAAVKSWLRENPSTGSVTPEPRSARWLFVPMRTGQRKAGVLAVAQSAMNKLLVPDSTALLGTLADLLAQAIHRIDLADDLMLANRTAEREELHAALIASLSHDLRTPLSSVIAAAECLIGNRDTPDNNSQRSLARSIQDDARRLDRYIANLLDMTRLESGLADASTSRIDLADAVSAALDRCAFGLSGHRATVELVDNLPLVAGDEVLLEHVLFNLLENAAKYTPPGTLIQLRAYRDRSTVVILVMDEGDGIRPADLERIFDKFYRGKRQGPQSPGIGLGLSICRGYIEAMGGFITARNRADRGGAVFTITLPIPAEKDLPDLDT